MRQSKCTRPIVAMRCEIDAVIGRRDGSGIAERQRSEIARKAAAKRWKS